MIDRDPDTIRTRDEFLATSVCACRESEETSPSWTDEEHVVVSVSVSTSVFRTDDRDDDDDDCRCQSENNDMPAMNSVLSKLSLLQYDRKAVPTRQETRPSTTSGKEED